MPNEITIIDAVNSTGSFLSSVASFTSGVGTLISNYRATKQIDKVKAQHIAIQSRQIIQQMKDNANYEIMANRMDIIRKAVEKAMEATDPVSRQLCMDYVLQLHNKFKMDFI